jgi:hypothetical protein
VVSTTRQVLGDEPPDSFTEIDERKRTCRSARQRFGCDATRRYAKVPLVLVRSARFALASFLAAIQLVYQYSY